MKLGREKREKKLREIKNKRREVIPSLSTSCLSNLKVEQKIVKKREQILEDQK